jgi:hypothetical protein
MRIRFILLLSLFYATRSLAQVDEINKKIDSLKYLSKDAYNCNSVYWRVVKYGKDAIPLLIARMDDTTETKATYVCKKGNLKLGDLCFGVLEEIMNVHYFYITQVGVYGYLDREREKFKQQLSNYYETYKNNLKFIKYSYSPEYPPNACKVKYKVYGYYDVDLQLLKDVHL